MRSVVRVWSGVTLVLALALAPAALAQSEKLREAIDLFEQQEYFAAQEVMQKLDRETLDEDERAQLDELLAIVPEAIKGNEKGTQDLAEAYAAYKAGEWEKADRLYQAVIENKYAPGRAHAAQQRERIAERIELGEVAKPTDIVEEKVPGESEERIASDEETPVTLEDAPAAMPTEGPRRLTPTEQLRLRDELLWQQAVAKAQALTARARTALADHNYLEARKLADMALQTIEVAARYAEPVSKYEAAKAEALALQEEVQLAADEYARVKAVQEREEIAQRVAQRRRQQEELKAEMVQQLFNSAGQLRRERRFKEAAEVLRQILRIDPANAQARYQLEVAEDYESFKAQREWQRDVRFEQRRSLLHADESLIPWDYDILYPKNWLELTARRQAQGTQVGADLEDLELNRKLEDPMEVRFDEQSFEQVIDFLTNYTGLNISVDWMDLDDALLDPAREKPVTLKLKNSKFRTVLKEVLTKVGGETELAFSVGDGLLRIATKEKLDKDKYILIYDIRDLLAIVPRDPRPDFTQQSQGLGQAGGGGSQNIFGSSQQNQQQQQEDLGGAAQMEKIKEIIRQAVEPDSWVEAGAGPGGGSIQDLSSQLLIYNTSDAHRQVVDLLSQLRQTQALQISVEARFLEVTANFLEEFGVDLDFVFNTGSAGYDRIPDYADPFTGAPVLIPRQFSRIGSVPSTPGFGQPMLQAPPGQPYSHAGMVPPRGGIFPHVQEMTPIMAQQSSHEWTSPSSINTKVPGSFAQKALTPALNIAGSFLDNLQVDFLIRATQANRRSSIVQAPRAVLTNGSSVQIRIEGVRKYVGSLEPVVGEAVAMPRPIVQDAISGINMHVHAVISADRRYTKLDISLFNQSEPIFDEYVMQRGSGNSPTLFMKLPSFDRITFHTMVSVPDGGTVLLGGFKQVGEVEVEAGVPILSKIPILKRAFTNQTTVKDTRTLLILVKAKILIQQEAEEEAFPTFSRLGA
ncbi:MAG: hypothetical protein KAY37_11415 [Phycisphaerae bacterium]|nr:hypothetical protein [Phycisphaerae bacterium]